jgi:hypothetical protein
MNIKDKELCDLLIRLKKISQVYGIANEEQRGRLLELSEPLIEKLMAKGFERTFVETLLIGGKDFVDSLYGEGTEVATDYDAQIIMS